MSKHYASVGAVHNKVDLQEELRVKKRWPTSSAYRIPGPPSEDRELEQVVTRSFNQVMTLCKDVALYKRETDQKLTDQIQFEANKAENNCVDLSPFMTQEFLTGAKNEISLNLSEDLLSHQIINIIEVDEDKGTVTIQSKANAQETITLYSGQTYLLDNKYFSNDDADFSNMTDFTHSSVSDPRIGLENDHNYSKKLEPDKKSDVEVSSDGLPKLENILQNKFNIEDVLRDLLVSTAALRCLVCKETPQEMINLLENAKRNC